MKEQTRSRLLDAQVGVLGSLLIDAEACAGDIFLRTREDFYTEAYRTIFEAARQLYRENRPIDPVTVKAIVGDDYAEFLLQLMELTPTAANAKAYVDLLVEEGQKSNLQQVGMALASVATLDEARELMEQAARHLNHHPSLRIVSARKGFEEFMIRQSEEVQYIDWGFPKINRTVFTSPGDFVILGGRPSSGKTALSVQMAWEQGKTKKVGYFSFETNPDEVYDRLMSFVAAADSTRIRNHRMGQEEADRAVAAMAAFSASGLEVINASGLSVADVRSITVARGYEVIYLDYLQIVNPGTDRGRYEEVSKISMDLHTLAVSLGVLVVALSQLRREEPGQKKTPELSHLRESGQIEQDADAVFLLYINDDGTRMPPRRLRIAKNKKGFAGGYIDLAFDGARQTFAELEQTGSAQEFIDRGKAVKAYHRAQPKLEALPGPYDGDPWKGDGHDD